MRFDLTFNYFPLGTLLMPAEPWSTIGELFAPFGVFFVMNICILHSAFRVVVCIKESML